MSFKDQNNEFQSCWMEIINNPIPNIVIGFLFLYISYRILHNRHFHNRHPKKASNGMFIEKLKDTLSKLKKANNKHILICGDFNYNLLNYEHNKYIGNFLNTMNSNLLQPHC